jgi:hypothetical protein
MCDNISDEYKQYYLQKGVGHYGVFSGSKFRQFIVPVIRDFVYKYDAAELVGRNDEQVGKNTPPRSQAKKKKAKG